MSQNPSSAVDVIGIDIGKNSFHVVALSAFGRSVYSSSYRDAGNRGRSGTNDRMAFKLNLGAARIIETPG
jgi:hypothetical protein